MRGVHDGGETGVFHGRGGQGLGFAQFRPGVVVGRRLAFHERGEPDDVEGKIALREQRPPVGDQRGEQRAVCPRPAEIGFALIPNRAGVRQGR